MSWPEHAALLGASGLLGSALTRALADRTKRLSLADPEAANLEALTDGLGDQHRTQISSTCLDIRDAPAVASWIETSHQEIPIDWLVVNAGLTGIAEEGAFMEAPERGLDLIATNLTGHISALQASLPLLRARGSGRIVLVCSLSALLGFSKAPIYAATKAGLRTLVFSLRPQAKRAGIDLTLACPGFLARPPGPGVAASRPFQISPEAAAKRILAGAAAGKTQILFPRRLVLLIRLLSLLPMSLRDRIV